MKIVLTGLLCESEADRQYIIDEFAKEKLPVQYVGQYKTLAGQGGEGGRSDVVFELEGSAVMRGAIHPWHLSGLFRWADDYYASDHEIVPEDSKEIFDGYTHYTEMQEEE
jgi:hypothetical protein